MSGSGLAAAAIDDPGIARALMVFNIELRKQLGEAKRPLHYLAVPPSLFATVAEALAQSGCADNARLVIEKPFGHNRATALALSRLLESLFPEENIFRIDH
jgi:glucose-6-phosphate 1-dehydrogenase